MYQNFGQYITGSWASKMCVQKFVDCRNQRWSKCRTDYVTSHNQHGRPWEILIFNLRKCWDSFDLMWPLKKGNKFPTLTLAPSIQKNDYHWCYSQWCVPIIMVLCQQWWWCVSTQCEWWYCVNWHDIVNSQWCVSSQWWCYINSHWVRNCVNPTLMVLCKQLVVVAVSYTHLTLPTKLSV